MKLNCNPLSIGQPGALHIAWQSAGLFLRDYASAQIEARARQWQHKPNVHTGHHPLMNFVSRKTETV